MDVVAGWTAYSGIGNAVEVRVVLRGFGTEWAVAPVCMEIMQASPDTRYHIAVVGTGILASCRIAAVEQATPIVA